MSEPDRDLGAHYLATVREEFRRLKRLGEKAIVQVGGDRLHTKLDRESNSIAIIVCHLSGNMVSRWTDFLSSDGEKPERNRDAEFEPAITLTRQDLMEAWDRGWRQLFETLSSLAPRDLEKKVRIRGEEHTVVEAISRQLSHYGYHVGQMVFLAKHLAGERWQSLSIPRGQSAKPWPYKGRA